MGPKMIFLAGAPNGQALLLEELSSTTLPEFESENLSCCRAMRSFAELIQPRWSAIPSRIPTEEAQRSQSLQTDSAEFLDSQHMPGKHVQYSTAATKPSNTDGHNEFLDASFRLHESEASFGSDETSFDSGLSSKGASGLSRSEHVREMSSLSITNLSDIPNAAWLRRIEPQTMTVNLAVGVISTHYRTVLTKATKQPVTLFELTLGDHTRSGFLVNIWLGPENGVNSPFFELTGRLRCGQVLLLQNLALNLFRDRVYGQSIRQCQTKIRTVHRKCSNDRLDLARLWLSEHIAPYSASGTHHDGFEEFPVEQLPGDTQ